MDDNIQNRVYSADVRISLTVLGKELEVAQVSSGWFILRNQVPIPPGSQATLDVRIGGQSRPQGIMIPHGTVANSSKIAYF